MTEPSTQQRHDPYRIIGAVSLHHVFVGLFISQVFIAISLVGLIVQNAERMRVIARMQASVDRLTENMDDLNRKLNAGAPKADGRD